MRTLSFIPLLSLFLYKVNALICYSCNSTTSNADCLMTNQTCQDICMTKYEKHNGQETVTVKQCARFATCKEEFDSGGNLVTCCSTDLCNNANPSSGATTIQTALLLLPIGVLSLLSKYHR